MSETVTVRLSTTGMHCGSCAMLIDMTIEELDGVDAVTTDYASGATEVTFRPGTVSAEEIISAIRAIGYDAEIV